MENRFDKNALFLYGQKEKIRQIAIIIFLVFFFTAIVFIYIFYLSGNSQNFLIKQIDAIFEFAISHISNRTLLGVFLSSAICNLLIVLIPPPEVVYINFLSHFPNPQIMLAVFLLGMLVSFMINYYMGYIFRDFVRKIISVKRFYWIKSQLNKYGGPLIFVFNLFPLPAQPLSSVLGVFRYSKTKFICFFLSGQIIKYIALTIFAYEVFL